MGSDQMFDFLKAKEQEALKAMQSAKVTSDQAQQRADIEREQFNQRMGAHKQATIMLAEYNKMQAAQEASKKAAASPLRVVEPEPDELEPAVPAAANGSEKS